MRSSESAMSKAGYLPFHELPMVPITTSARHCQRGKLNAYALDVRLLTIYWKSVCSLSQLEHDFSVLLRNLSSCTLKQISKFYMQNPLNKVTEKPLQKVKLASKISLRLVRK